MKVVLINTSERTGGAAIACNRLMKALRKNGHEAVTIVLDKQSNDDRVIVAKRGIFNRLLSRFNFYWELLVIFINNRFKKKYLFSVSLANTGFDISKHPLIQNADIIHLHWVNHGFLSLKSIQKLIERGKPVVWTLHDMWSATGICHYPYECTNYQSGCHDCQYLLNPHKKDLSYTYFNKKRSLGLDKIQYVGCSKWIAGETEKGAFLSGASFTSIPNPIDTNIFSPKERIEARKRFNLPQDKYLLLFSAAKISDERKGGIYFVEACNYLQTNYPEIAEKTEVLLMGQGDSEFFEQIRLKVNTLSYISDEESMAYAYSAADAFVIPSLGDNLPNTIMESMACGTPCIGFNVGGIPEMIEHKTNGYIAEYKDSKDLMAGIIDVLDPTNLSAYSSNAVKKVNREYKEAVIVQSYTQLYQRLLDE
ncbi:glycosyltransferase [Bacteroidales bacterium OttesenSCG-928-I14]|nr:glycosyltransferase [Bacteroidales bacterium OttesenSCG-928-I14]